MYRIKITSRFKRSYKLARKRGLDMQLLDHIIGQLQQGLPLDPKYRDHALQGSYSGFRECHIQSDWLLLYLLEDDILILTLVDTGTHSDLFEK